MTDWRNARKAWGLLGTEWSQSNASAVGRLTGNVVVICGLLKLWLEFSVAFLILLYNFKSIQHVWCTLKMEAVCSFVTLIPTFRFTLRLNPKATLYKVIQSVEICHYCRPRLAANRLYLCCDVAALFPLTSSLGTGATLCVQNVNAVLGVIVFKGAPVSGCPHVTGRLASRRCASSRSFRVFL
jgi:hypothetical protein